MHCNTLFLASLFVSTISASASSAEYATCPFRKSYPHVLMMQPGQNGRGDNGPASLDRSR
jgi:hypothetical protein